MKTSTLARSLVALVLVVFAAAAAAAFEGSKAKYMGGTIPGLMEKVDGEFLTSSPTEISFNPKRSAMVTFRYASITELEYGQKAGRRVGAAILISPLALFSKKRDHFLTITYKDKNGVEQAGVFEIEKDSVRTLLKILELRSKKEIQFQDAEACQQYKTAKECKG